MKSERSGEEQVESNKKRKIMRMKQEPSAVDSR
jgi:hypothetical protein